MENCRQFVARAIYHHHANTTRHIPLLVFKDSRNGMSGMVYLESTRGTPVCWDGTRDEVLEKWRHLKRVLQAEWFLHEPRPNSENDFDEFI